MGTTMSGRTRAAARVVTGAAVVAIIAVAFPRVTGAGWAAVGEQLSRLTPGQLGLAFLLWSASLLAYAVLCARALPGLRVAQAMTMHLASSAASNVAPFGAALGVGVSFGMARSWGFTAAEFTLYSLLTGLVNLLVRLVLPVLAVLTLGPSAGGQLHAITAGAGALALLALLALLVASPRAALQRLAAAAQAVAVRGARLLGSHRQPQLDTALLDGHARLQQLLGGGWAVLAVAALAATAAQAALMWLCLHAFGLELGLGPVLAVFALERVLSSVPVTPSGLGVTETGCAALLVSLGAPATAAAAAVLLFRGFIYLAEIPAGALAALTWAGRRSWRRSPNGGPAERELAAQQT